MSPELHSSQSPQCYTLIIPLGGLMGKAREAGQGIRGAGGKILFLPVFLEY